jgi:hypothetical protein
MFDIDLGALTRERGGDLAQFVITPDILGEA